MSYQSIFINNNLMFIIIFFSCIYFSTLPANGQNSNESEIFFTEEIDDQNYPNTVVVLDNFSLFNQYDFLTKEPWSLETIIFDLVSKYKSSDFFDTTPWHELLNFIDWHYSEITKQDYQNHDYEKECNQILSVSVIFLSGAQPGMTVAEDFLHYIDGESLEIDLKNAKVLRLFEIFLRDIKIPIRMIPQLPPYGIIEPPYKKDQAMGHMAIHTKKGDFIIELKRNCFLLTSEQTMMKYRFYSQGIALLLDKILNDENGKHVPKATLNFWSGDLGDKALIETYLDPEYDCTTTYLRFEDEIEVGGYH